LYLKRKERGRGPGEGACRKKKNFPPGREKGRLAARKKQMWITPGRGEKKSFDFEKKGSWATKKGLQGKKKKFLGGGPLTCPRGKKAPKLGENCPGAGKDTRSKNFLRAKGFPKKKKKKKKKRKKKKKKEKKKKKWSQLPGKKKRGKTTEKNTLVLHELVLKCRRARKKKGAGLPTSGKKKKKGKTPGYPSALISKNFAQRGEEKKTTPPRLIPPEEGEKKRGKGGGKSGNNKKWKGPVGFNPRRGKKDPHEKKLMKKERREEAALFGGDPAHKTGRPK